MPFAEIWINFRTVYGGAGGIPSSQEGFPYNHKLITVVYAYIYNQPGKCVWSGKEKHSSSLKMHAWNVYIFNIHNINIKYKLCKAVVYTAWISISLWERIWTWLETEEKKLN